MRLDPNPLFRRTITPWYDGTVACFTLMGAMLAVIGFSAVGISVTRTIPEFQAHAWVPWTVLILSLLVFISVALRFLQRRLSERFGAERVDESE